jgi:hypothetical protein
MAIYTSHISASAAVSSSYFKGTSASTGSFGRVEATTLKGDGSAITGLSSAAITSVAGMTNNYVLTATGAAAVTGESTLTFDGSTLGLTGALTATGNISSSATSTGSFGKVAATSLAGTLSTAAQTNITSVGTLSGLVVGSVSPEWINILSSNTTNHIDGVIIGSTVATSATFTTLASTGNTTIGNASGDSLTINAANIDVPNMPAGTDNSVVVRASGVGNDYLVTDEIDPRVWGTTLLDGSNGTNNELAIFTDANTVEGDSKVTWDGSTFTIGGDLIAENYIVSSSVTYMTTSFSSGSTIFGDDNADTHQFTGSLAVTGSATFSEALTNLTLVTPALGTPTALVLTNATALPAAQVSQGTMASGMVLVAPALGTPASGVLTNCTALPAAQVSQGTMASGMVLVAPALGTPASGVMTNVTGTAANLTAGTVSTIAGLAPNTATTQATQGAITSLGTLTRLTVSSEGSDRISISGTGQLIDGMTIGSNTAAAGTFTTLTSTGNTTIGNALDPGVHTINGQLKNFSKASGSAVSTGSFGRVEATKISGTLTTAAQTSITSLGTLTDLEFADGQGCAITTDGFGDGTINGFTIGGSEARPGTFTTVTTSGNVSGSSVSTGSFGYIYTAGGGVTAGTILPSADNSYDLGSLTNRFANLYVGDLLLSNKSRGGNEVDGTYGDYTIQEGEEDLFLLNNRSGKTYRFKLEEVDAKPWYKKIFS